MTEFQILGSNRGYFLAEALDLASTIQAIACSKCRSMVLAFFESAYLWGVLRIQEK